MVISTELPPVAILLVDDMPSNIRILREAVKDLGEIFYATTGNAALEIARTRQPDVILLDIEMPGMDGYAICKAIKADPLISDTAIIFVTAHEQEIHELQALRYGGVDFIHKPLNIPITRARVETQLALQRKTRLLQLTQQDLLDEKERLRITLNSIGDAVIATDKQGNITFINPIAETLTGWTSAEAIGQAIETVMPLRDGNTSNELQNPIRLALKEERIVGMAFDCVLFNRHQVSLPVEDSAAPIRNHEGAITGAIIVFHDMSEARAMAIKMTHLAQHDALTNLPNRILLRDRTEQMLKKAERYNTQVGMLLLDIDHFKIINDTYSHLLGDRLLQEIARSLTSILRSSDTLCRQGGDEFIVLLADFDNSVQVADFAARLLALFNQPWPIDNIELKLSASIGISIYPDDSKNMDELYRHADAAMYMAKKQGRNRYLFYSNEIENRLRTHMALEAHLRNALTNNVFEVFYQPKVDARTNQIIGAEALVRWRNNGELVFPDVFIPLAEETGLIIPLGKLILQKACTQAKIWADQGLHLQVAINVSAVQFNNEFVQTVAETLKLTGANPQQIELEITESLLVSDDNASAIMRQLQQLGVRIALDDFGTGYSSLSYLKRFPLDVLKIDQSFVRNMLDDEVDISIVKAIVQMAAGLKLRLVAEGVETRAHVDVLLGLGCHIMQGYYYSRPVPLQEINTLLKEGLNTVEQ